MRKRSLTGLFVIAALFVSAQDVNLKWGVDLNNDNFIVSVLGEDQGGVYTHSKRKDRHFIEKFSGSDFSFLSAKEIEMKAHEKGHKEEMEMLLKLKNEFLLFTSFYDRKEDKSYLIGYRLSNDGTLTGEGKKILELEAKTKRRRGEFEVKLSSDSTKLLVYNKAIDKKEQILRFAVVDLNFNELGRFQENFPIEIVLGNPEPNPVLSVANFVITAERKLYVLLNEYRNNKQFDYSIIGFDIASKNKSRFPIELPDEKISNVTFSVEPDGKLSVFGYYVDRVKKGFLRNLDAVIGVFYMKADVFGKTAESLIKQDFDQKLVEQYVGKKKYTRGERLPAYFTPRHIVNKKDGGKLLISEYMEVKQESGISMSVPFGSPMQQQTEVITQFLYNDILVTSVNPEGKIEWTTIIGKKQKDERSDWVGGTPFGIIIGPPPAAETGSNSVYYSFLLVHKNDKLYFIFNDHPDNIQQTEFSELSQLNKPKKGVPVVVTVDINGNVKKSVIENAKEGEMLIRPLLAKQVDPDNIIIYGLNKTSDKLGRLILK